MMVPDAKSGTISLQVSDQPIGHRQKLLPALGIARTAKGVEIAQTELRNSYRVVLPAQAAPVIEQRNSPLVIRPWIVRLLQKRHVVLAQFVRSALGVDLRGIV